MSHLHQIRPETASVCLRPVRGTSKAIEGPVIHTKNGYRTLKMQTMPSSTPQTWFFMVARSALSVVKLSVSPSPLGCVLYYMLTWPQALSYCPRKMVQLSQNSKLAVFSIATAELISVSLPIHETTTSTACTSSLLSIWTARMR
jgi:hypothetical protein